MAEPEAALTSFDPAQLDEVKNLLSDLKEQANKAHEDGNLYLLSVYNKLLKVTSPIVVSAQARIEREANAETNRKEKEMRKAAHAQREAARKQREAAREQRQQTASA